MRLNNSLPQTITHWAQSSMSALSSGFAGLLNSGNQHQEASQDLMNGMTLGTNSEQQQEQGVNVSISQEYHQRLRGSDNTISVERTQPSPESSVASINEAGITYSASARLVKATSAMVDAFFDAIA